MFRVPFNVVHLLIHRLHAPEMAAWPGHARPRDGGQAFGASTSR